MGGLQQDARAIARIGLAAARAAVRQIDQDRERIADDLVGLLALDVHDKADAAGIVFKLRVVQPLLLRPTVRRGGVGVTHCAFSNTRLGV